MQKEQLDELFLGDSKRDIVLIDQHLENSSDMQSILVQMLLQVLRTLVWIAIKR